MPEGKIHAPQYDYGLTTYKPVGLRARSLLIAALLIALDYFTILAAAGTAYLIRDAVVPQFLSSLPPAFDVAGIYMYAIIPCVFILFMHFDNLYTRRLLFWQQVGRVFKVSVYAMIFVVILMYLTGDAGGISRIFIVSVWAVSFLYLVASKYLSQIVMAAAGLWQIPVVLVGAGKTAELLIDAFKNYGGLGYKIIGLVEDNVIAATLSDYPVIGTFDKAEEAVKRTGVKDVLIAAPGLTREELLGLVYRLQPHVDNITFVPDLFGVPVGDMQLDTLFNEKAVLLRIRNNLASEYNRILKYSFDFVTSTCGLVVILPIIALISLIIYLDSPGPVIFAHKRIGKNGQTFSCYKFRSMIPNAQEVLKEYLAGNADAREEWARDFKLKDDPRITRIGGFLRKTSLDELPQLFNVIKGEMSLVGPRPIVAGEVPKYGKYIYDYYLVRPGITGMWQVSGRNDIDYDERVQLDSWYVRNWSLWLDIMLLFKTVRVVLKGKGAY